MDGKERRKRRADSDNERTRNKRRRPDDDESDPRRRRRNERSDQEIPNERQPRDRDWGRSTDDKNNPVEKEKPSLEVSGKLAEDTNTFKGIVIKYNEPPEARKPKRRWRLYIFKGSESLPYLPVHRQSAYLIGRDRRVADIPVDHPSCSKQHAAFQYRLKDYRRQDGSSGRQVCPYIIDLNSANGTFVNGTKIEPQRYVELFEKDVVKFGFSSRDYVLLHEKSDGHLDDEVA